MYILPKCFFNLDMYKLSTRELLFEKIKDWNLKVKNSNKIDLYLIKKEIISSENQNIICRYVNEFKKVHCCDKHECFKKFLKLNRLYKFLVNNKMSNSSIQHISILNQKNSNVFKKDFFVFEKCCECILMDLEIFTKIYMSIVNNYYYSDSKKERYYYKHCLNLEDLCKSIKSLEYLYGKYKNTNFIKIFKRDNKTVVRKIKGEYYFRIIL